MGLTRTLTPQTIDEFNRSHRFSHRGETVQSTQLNQNPVFDQTSGSSLPNSVNEAIEATEVFEATEATETDETDETDEAIEANQPDQANRFIEPA